MDEQQPRRPGQLKSAENKPKQAPPPPAADIDDDLEAAARSARLRGRKWRKK